MVFPVAAKAGVLAAVVLGGSVSVWYFSDSIFGSPLVSITEEERTTYGAGSIGKKYGDYFLSSKKNQKVWEKRYEENKGKFSVAGANNTGTKAKDKFGTVTEAYSNDSNNTTALNKVCDAAYQLKNTANTNLVDTEPTADDTNNSSKFSAEFIWKFCGLRSISIVGDDSSYNDKIGGADTEKKLFVSIKGEGNDWFWDLKTKEFWKGQITLAGNSQDGNVFKKFKETVANQNQSIKATCDEAYKKGKSEDTNIKNKEDALIFCSIKLTVGAVAAGG